MLNTINNILTKLLIVTNTCYSKINFVKVFKRNKFIQIPTREKVKASECIKGPLIFTENSYYNQQSN